VEGSEDELDLTITVGVVISTPRSQLLLQETMELDDQEDGGEGQKPEEKNGDHRLMMLTTGHSRRLILIRIFRSPVRSEIQIFAPTM
jgi:hypothetical protein